MWRKGSNNYAKTFFSIYFQFLFLTSFHLVGSKSWDSFILLNESANTDFSFFLGGGGRGGGDYTGTGAIMGSWQWGAKLQVPFGISIALLTEKWATHFLHFDLTVWWCCVAFSHTPTFEIPTRSPSNDGLLSLPIYLHSAWKSRKKGLFRVEDLSYIRSMEYPGTVQDNHEVLLLYVYYPGCQRLF